ncbi:MAG: AraC family transcriptional regulator [Gemmatimonadaceae bacterium]
MCAPARFESSAIHTSQSSVFAGPHVQLDEGRWSPAFEMRLNAWAATSSTLVVMESGIAMARVRQAAQPCTDARDDSWTTLPAFPAPPRVGAMELCGVFRFDASAVGAALTAPHARDAGVVRLSAPALFRYSWRRRALDLDYPAPAEHVEDDAKALLRHVVSRAQRAAALDDDSPRRTRHRTLATNASVLMANSFADPTTIDGIARSLGTSPFHLAHVFRAEIGCTPHQYLTQLRVVEAMVRLRAGAPDLSRLALELGFCHHSHFTSVFRRAIGYTPRQVRRMLTASNIRELGIITRDCPCVDCRMA